MYHHLHSRFRTSSVALFFLPFSPASFLSIFCFSYFLYNILSSFFPLLLNVFFFSLLFVFLVFVSLEWMLDSLNVRPFSLVPFVSTCRGQLITLLGSSRATKLSSI